ncbi:hypothetical protein BGZ70_010254 [Mortierella alpina]|uniref:Protein kinase domain-containing protein n=1 Tax=Mortierella alpina TaxID=64518 RepID=A0A9P6J031_MORAP|nr:hypothetical protein BGZ70_010254 [Mortierella alpina]
MDTPSRKGASPILTAARENAAPLRTEDDPFDSPAFIVQSPTATMSQSDNHPRPFPMLANSPQQPASLPHLLSSFSAAQTSVTDSAFSFNTEPAGTMASPGSDTIPGDSSSSSQHGRTLSAETAASRSSSRRSSVQFSRHIEVKETLDASVTETADGQLQLKQYVLKRIIGQGAYGIVNLGVDITTGVGYAIKEFSKSKLRKRDRANLFRLGPRGRGRGPRGPEAPIDQGSKDSSPLDLIRGEIAILKKLNHVNIVKLYEVLDVATEDSMFMVFELCQKGVLTEVSLGDKTGPIFSDAECRDVFQQMVLGIEYLHEHDIIHRDIKPDNLLRSEDGTLKIVDFGVSEMFTKKGDDLIKKSAGSPAFMAPELCEYGHGEVSGKATDVWSMGVTLFCIRYGRLPFRTNNIVELNRCIREDKADFDEEQDPDFKHLMERLLEKDPAKRITTEELRNDPWLTNHGLEPLISKEENTQNAVTEVTDDDLRKAIQSISGLVTVLNAIYKFKRLLKTPSPRSSSRDRREKSEGEEPLQSALAMTPTLLSSDKFQDESKPALESLEHELTSELLTKIESLKLTEKDAEAVDASERTQQPQQHPLQEKTLYSPAIHLEKASEEILVMQETTHSSLARHSETTKVVGSTGVQKKDKVALRDKDSEIPKPATCLVDEMYDSPTKAVRRTIRTEAV